MEYKKGKTYWMIQQIYHLNLGQEMGLKYMMDDGKRVTSVSN